jgi:sterol desaturase/sphingolipid hydroxylase (fatty acid hydroxylase superfamily)
MNATQIQNILVLSMILGFAAMELISRRYQNTVTATANDTKLELFMFLSLVAITQPLAMFTTAKLGAWLAPEYKDVLTDWPWWAMVGILLLCDDLTQYWWHRLSHSPLLWPLHRAHHSAAYMSIRITYRNNFFYYLMMPGLWFAGALLYMGVSGMVYALYVVVKLSVIMGAHCAWRWDEPLYKISEPSQPPPPTGRTMPLRKKMGWDITRATLATSCSFGTLFLAQPTSRAGIPSKWV